MVRAAYVGTAGEDAHWDNHRKFHTALISPAASAWDFRLLVPLWDAAERYTRLVYDTIADSAETTAERKHAHDALITAAGSRDPEEIRDELRRHLETNLSQTLDAMHSIATPDTHPYG